MTSKRFPLIGALLGTAVGATLITSGCGVLVTTRDTDPNPIGQSGPVVTRQFDFTDFDAVEISDSFKFEITASDTYLVEVKANESLFEGMSVEKAGKTLKIRMDWPGVVNLGSRASEVRIAMPELAGLKISGASTGSVTGFTSSRDLDVEISGSSSLDLDAETGEFTSQLSGASRLTARNKSTGVDMELSGSSSAQLEVRTGAFRFRASGASRGSGSVDAAGTNLSLSSSSHVNFTGSGGDMVLSASGASAALLQGFEVRDADICLSGSSHADADLGGKLDVSLSGASELRYGGNPTLGERMEISGGSRFERRS
jgi:hypothetical protein